MSELSHLGSTPRTQNASVRIRWVAEQQWGAISRRQLREAGLSKAGIARWIADGRLHRLHPGVYALGHRRLASEGQLLAALLYAGPGALLSHRTAAWWWQLIAVEPTIISVSGPGRRRSVPGVLVHHPRSLDSARHRHLPVTTVPRTMLDYASTVTFDRVRRALAEADYRQILNLEAMQGVLGCGRPGSARLSRALEHHQPELALTRSVLEERFLALCEAAGIALPEVNTTVEGLMVDALWGVKRVIVELDGRPAHSSPAQIERDRQRELRLRAAGFVVVRYTWRQIKRDPEQVVSDLRSVLSSPAPSAGPGSR